MRSFIKKPEYQYINELFATENHIQQHIREQIIASGVKPIQIEAFEGKILSMLIQATASKKILEFGTMHGYSTTWLAESVPDGSVLTIEKNPESANIASKNLKSYTNVTILTLDAQNAEAELAEFAPFDFVFIDANKSAYQNYFTLSDRLLKKGGMIVADNCIFDDMFSNIQNKLVDSICGFNQFVAAKQNYHSVILPSAGGLLCALKL
jgi:predicted O-methyltransferase YrrM